MVSYKWGYKWGNHNYNPYEGTYNPTKKRPMHLQVLFVAFTQLFRSLKHFETFDATPLLSKDKFEQPRELEMIPEMVHPPWDALQVPGSYGGS